MDVGVIAEEINDVEVLYELTCKLTNPRGFSFKKFVGHGCGKLRRKCGAWAKNLLQRGCSHLIVIHDLDNNDETQLRRKLLDEVRDVDFGGLVILIPIREIEAWLLADAEALRTVFRIQAPLKTPVHPETVQDPKQKLRDVVWSASRKHYVNTIHNKKIAGAMRIETLQACPSFNPYPQFVRGLTSN